MMSGLKLYGMRSAYDETLAAALKRKHEPQRFVADLLKAEISEKQARSIKYQLTVAKLPLAKDVEDFAFKDTPINEALARDLAGGAFPEVSAERRPIAVMVCDRVGSTHLAAKLDAEDRRNLVNACLDEATKAVTGLGGHVLKLGDGLMALFGYPQAQENDAERAARAALAIQRALAEVNARNAGKGPPELSARIGLDSGPVVVDAMGEVFGDAPNIAARVREEELSLIGRRWERALKGEGQLVLIVGEPGLGKSRLIDEFRRRLADTPHTWRSGAPPSSSRIRRRTRSPTGAGSGSGALTSPRSGVLPTLETRSRSLDWTRPKMLR
jgi:IstB-like ATP binding protein/Adenylate and Guanylate cyclase catalytic domain/AAA ATPase domain